MSVSTSIMNYGWTVPVGTQQSHYVLSARLIGKAGWLGKTACGEKAGGHVPLQAAPIRKACESCLAKVGK